MYLYFLFKTPSCFTALRGATSHIVHGITGRVSSRESVKNVNNTDCTGWSRRVKSGEHSDKHDCKYLHSFMLACIYKTCEQNDTSFKLKVFFLFFFSFFLPSSLSFFLFPSLSCLLSFFLSGRKEGAVLQYASFLSTTLFLPAILQIPSHHHLQHFREVCEYTTGSPVQQFRAAHGTAFVQEKQF